MTQFCPICAHGVLLGSHMNSESLTGIDSDGEAFATTASAGDVRVVEDELGGQLCLLVIHLGAQERQLGFLVYIDGHTVLKKQSKYCLYPILCSFYSRLISCEQQLHQTPAK